MRPIVGLAVAAAIVLVAGLGFMYYERSRGPAGPMTESFHLVYSTDAAWQMTVPGPQSPGVNISVTWSAEISPSSSYLVVTQSGQLLGSTALGHHEMNVTSAGGSPLIISATGLTDPNAYVTGNISFAATNSIAQPI